MIDLEEQIHRLADLAEAETTPVVFDAPRHRARNRLALLAAAAALVIGGGAIVWATATRGGTEFDEDISTTDPSPAATATALPVPTAAPAPEPTVAAPATAVPTAPTPTAEPSPTAIPTLQTDSTYASRSRPIEAGGEIYAGAQQGGVLRTWDQGLSWEWVGEGYGGCLSSLDGLLVSAGGTYGRQDMDEPWTWDLDIFDGVEWVTRSITGPIGDSWIGQPCRVASVGGTWVLAFSGWQGEDVETRNRVIWAYVSEDQFETWKVVQLLGLGDGWGGTAAQVNVYGAGEMVLFEAGFYSESIGGSFRVIVPVPVMQNPTVSTLVTDWWVPLLGSERGYRHIEAVGDTFWATEIQIAPDSHTDHELVCGAEGVPFAGPHPDELVAIPGVQGACPQVHDIDGVALIEVRGRPGTEAETTWWLALESGFQQLPESPVLEWQDVDPDVPVTFVGATREGRALVVPHTILPPG